jgi:hypothetical protein
VRLPYAVLLVAAIAEASPAKPPIGWTTDPAASVSMSKRLGEVAHFGGLSTSPITEVYRSPQPGGSLFVTRVFAATKPEERNRAATIELAEIDAAMKRAGADAVSDFSLTRVIPDLRLLEARINWANLSTGIKTYSRMVIAGDDKQVVAVTGECVLAGTAAADLVTACTAALASLDPEIPAGSRVVLNIVDTKITAAPPTQTPPTSGSAAPAMLEGGHPALPPMSIPQEERTPDRRPIYVGFGLVVLALIFYWNRKNREKLERAYETEGTQTPKPEKPRDRDADDLHAAASDEGGGSGTKEGS